MIKRSIVTLAAAAAGGAAVIVGDIAIEYLRPTVREAKVRARVARHVLRGKPVIWNADLGPVQLKDVHGMMVERAQFDTSRDHAPERAEQAVAEAFAESMEGILESVRGKMRASATAVSLEGESSEVTMSNVTVKSDGAGFKSPFPPPAPPFDPMRQDFWQD